MHTYVCINGRISGSDLILLPAATWSPYDVLARVLSQVAGKVVRSFWNGHANVLVAFRGRVFQRLDRKFPLTSRKRLA